MQVNARRSTPLATWFAGPGAEARFRARVFRRRPVLLKPRDRAWRAIAPGFDEWPRIAAEGSPFQVAADRRYDRSGDPRRLRPALGAGKTVFFPQVHQVLPRLARLMAALRATFFGPGREECSFLFLVEGRGREGMGPHHDGDVDAFWLQLAGRRTVTIGAPVPRGTPEDLPDSHLERMDVTLALGPGTLFHVPARTPHRVLCHERSLALSLTWGRRSPRAASLATWDVVSGRADRVPPRSRTRLWTQAPVAGLSAMPSWRLPLTPAERARLSPLVERGVVGSRELPLRIVPADPSALDGWRFA
jgi:hypothetical protein